jgi:hypothetical protein
MRLIFAGLLGLAAATASATARADTSIIKSPGDHPQYRFEAEPHGLVGFGGPFDRGRADLGAGFRGTINIVDHGFIKKLNDSVGISFGADLFFRDTTIYIPVAMQWNFWLTEHWSVFGEPGVGFVANGGRGVVHPAFSLGGRYHFNERISLTMRIGYPAFAIGASFFL